MSGSMPHDPKSQCVLYKFLSQEWVTKHVTSSQLGSLTKHVTWYHIENVTMCYRKSRNSYVTFFSQACQNFKTFTFTLIIVIYLILILLYVMTHHSH